MRVVLDTNVLLAAFATRGLCESLFEMCLSSQEIVLSPYILAELQRILEGKLKMSATEARRIERYLREVAQIVEPADVSGEDCPDPDDLPVLGTAVAGEASILVTGDAELLALGQCRGIAIRSPREFYDNLRRGLA